MDTTLLILAAGMGSRYGGLKQLDPVGPSGETILDYSVYDAIRAGFTKVVFIVREDFRDLFEKQIATKYEGKIKVELVCQELTDLPEGFTVPEGREKPWGTAHAMLCAKGAINEPFCVINADDFYSHQAIKVAHEFLTSDKVWKTNTSDVLNFAMVGFKLANTLSENGSVARGVCEADDDSNLVNIEEMLKISKTADGAENLYEDGITKKLTGEEPVSMNMWCFSPEVFQCFEEAFKPWLEKNIQVKKSEFLIPTEVDNLIQSGKATVKVLHTDAKWFGVTYKEDKPFVESSIQRLVDSGDYPEKLF